MRPNSFDDELIRLRGRAEGEWSRYNRYGQMPHWSLLTV
jgi:hypothetical protein